MTAILDVAGRLVGEGQPCFIVAEAGANHNRDFATACRLIDAAVVAGADAIKFQTYSADTLYSRKTPQFSYLRELGNVSTHDLLQSIEIPRAWHADLASYCRERRIVFFSSPFDRAAVDELDAVGVPLFKIASFELVDLPLIRHTASMGKPVVLSTGMATWSEIDQAVEACREAGNTQVVLLQCASVYPASPALINMRAMRSMREAFQCPVGLSDHTRGIAVAIGAVGFGCALLEKHVTLDRGMSGPDHPFAIEPAELAAMVQGVRDVEAALGDGRKAGPNAAEQGEMYRLARRSLIAACPIPAGTTISAEMITVKRPGYGIKPALLDLVVGRIARRAIDEDDVITWDMV